MVAGLRPLMHIEFISVDSVRKRSGFTLLPVALQCLGAAHCRERLALSSLVVVCAAAFLVSLLCSTHLCLLLCQYLAVWNAAAFWCSLKSESMIP